MLTWEHFLGDALSSVEVRPESDVQIPEIMNRENMRHLHRAVIPLVFVALLLLSACGGNQQESGGGAEAGGTDESGLTPEQLEKGIGPVTNVDIDDIDDDLAESGEEIFETKCSACHKMDSRYVGPALGDVLERRSPEFVMNMMLNPEEMLQKHPDVREMLAQFMTPMPDQQLSQDDARAVLEYLREEDDERHEDDQSEHDDDHRASD